MTYADKLAVPYVIILGDDEVRDNAASVKNMSTGEQLKLPMDQVAAHIQKGLAPLNEGTPIVDRGAQEG